jgi:hypothetical protein
LIIAAGPSLRDQDELGEKVAGCLLVDGFHQGLRDASVEIIFILMGFDLRLSTSRPDGCGDNAVLKIVRAIGSG